MAARPGRHRDVAAFYSLSIQLVIVAFNERRQQKKPVILDLAGSEANWSGIPSGTRPWMRGGG
ncbi:hypothetical protein CYK37_15040 [Mesorhizobium loti]|nr:hypothetical protein CYK37_15040 [Mesorhizobium loti]